MKNIQKYDNFINESKLQDDYRAFFSKLLDLYGIKSPAAFKSKPEKSKEFYGEITKGWSKGKGLTKYGEKLMDMEELVAEVVTEEVVTEEVVTEEVVTEEVETLDDDVETDDK